MIKFVVKPKALLTIGSIIFTGLSAGFNYYVEKQKSDKVETLIKAVEEMTKEKNV